MPTLRELSNPQAWHRRVGAGPVQRRGLAVP